MIVPPLTVGVTVDIAVPFVKVNEFGLYASDDGATSFTSMVTLAGVASSSVGSRNRITCR